MTYEFLKKNGTFLGETDLYSNGIYFGNKKFFLYDDCLYVREEPDNRISYRGKTNTYILIDNVKDAINQNSEIYFCEYLNLPEEAYKNLCKESKRK